MNWFDELLLEEEKKKKEEEEKKKGVSGDIAPVASTYLTGAVPNSGTSPYAAALQPDAIAPVKETGTENGDKQKWYEGYFKKGAFEDGRQQGDAAKVILGTSTDAGKNLLTGIVGMGEQAVDMLAKIVPYATRAQFNDVSSVNQRTLELAEQAAGEVKKASTEFIKKDLYDEEAVAKQLLANIYVYAENAKGMQYDQIGTAEEVKRTAAANQQALDYLENGVEDHSVLGEKTDALLQSAGQLAATMGLQAVGVPWWVTSGITAFGSEAENALNQGATYEEATLSAIISAGAEVLTEQISGGIKFKGKTLDDVITKALARSITDKFWRTAAKVGLDVVGEGAEEVLTENLNRFGQWLTYRSDEELKELLWSEEAMQAKIDAFVGGSLMGGTFGTGKAMMASAKGMDYASEMTNNEKAVVDRVYKELVDQEAKSGKVTEKRKAEIYDEVLEQLEDGGFSIDTIEEVLGGETYRTYQSAEAERAKLQEEYDKLYSMKNSEKSNKQIDREAYLKERLENKERNAKQEELKKKYTEGVQAMALQDRLGESYRQRDLRGKAFDADLSQYDAKQQETIRRAVDSGILNNTRRTHKFVDMIAKISADKGVTFDFTNNERLKESGFAIEGKTVNGYITGDSITLNINSPKALNKVVGHEVTHVLEGTELYAELQEMLISMADAKGELQSRTQALEKLYEGVEGADVTAELTADLVGDYLFNDTDFISRLSTETPDVFQKIFDEIKYLCKVATAGSKEAKQLLAVQKKFEEVYREAGTKNPTAEGGVRYALGQQSATGTQSQYAYMKPFGDQLADYQNGTFPERDVLLLGGTPNVLKEIGLAALPMVINQKHIGDALNGTYKGTQQEKLDHTFTMQELSTLPEKLADPVAVIYDKRTGKANASKSTIDVLVEMTVASGKQVLAAVQIGGNGHINGIRIDTNKVATVHGNADSINRLIDAINENAKGNVAVFYINNDKTTKVLKSAGNPIPGSLSNLDGFIYSINDPGSPVKNRIASETESQQFKRWFGDWQNHPENASKVVNADGTPKVVYHGSYSNFSVFDGNARKHSQSPVATHFFTDDIDVGYSYTGYKEVASPGGHAYKGGIYPVYLNIRNPYVVDFNGRTWSEKINGMDVNETAQYAKDNGYDGLIVHNVIDEGGNGDQDWDENIPKKPATDYVVFDSTQIKSATDNIGTFDRNNPDIRYDLSSGEDIAPLPGQVYGKDIMLEAPVREDLDTGIVPDSSTEGMEAFEAMLDEIQIRDTRQKLDAIREHSQQELEANKKYRQEAREKYDQKIADAQAKYDSKKNKDTKLAQALLKRIEQLKRLQADIDAGYSKRISDIERRLRKTDAELEKDHSRRDSYQKALARIDRYLEQDKAALEEEHRVRMDAFGDKNAWTSQRATELYQELRHLKQGKRASGELSYLLDLRKEKNWSYDDLRAALMNVRHTPGETVNRYSPVEQAVREMLEGSFEADREAAELDYDEKLADLEAEAEEKRIAARTSNQAKVKHEQHLEEVRELVGDTSTWVDKPLGIQYATNTLLRNLRDVVRGADGKTDYARAQAIFDYLGGSYNHNEAQLKQKSNEIKKWYQEQKITGAESVYIQMLGERLYNPETTVTDQQLEEYFEEHKSEIDAEKVYEVIEQARADYDVLFDWLNETLRANGMKEIPYRKGYFPHLKSEGEQSLLAKILDWKKTDNKIPTDIAGLTEDFNPPRSYQSFNKQRTGDATEYDFLKGFDAYVHGALDWIYHIEDIQKRREFENYIRYIHSDQGIKDRVDAVYENDLLNADQVQAEIESILNEAKNPLGNFVTDLRTQTNLLAAKKHSLDRGMEQMVNRDVYSVASNISSRVSANMVAGSISAAMSNFIPITQSWGEVSPMYTLSALGDAIRFIRSDDGMVEKSDFLTNRLIEEEKLDRDFWDKAGDKVGWLMNGVDHLVSQTVWRSKYRQNLAEGMSESEAIRNADQFAENLMAGRSRGNQPTLFESKNLVTKMFTAFQLEVNNQYGYLFKDLPAEMRNEAKGKLVGAYGRIFIGAYLYNALSKVITGREMAFDPIRILQELIGGIADEEEDDSEDIVAFAENVLEQVPFVGGLMGGGRVPISSALPYDGNVMDAVTGVAEAAESGDWKSVWSELQNPMWYLLPPMAGGQIRKTVQGLAMYPKVAKLWGEELPTAGSYTDSGALRFTVGKDWGSALQAALFGQWAGKNAQEYIDEGRAPLQEKQMEEFLSLDVPIQEYWEYRDGLKGLETLNEQADYIASLDLPVEKKNILINNIAGRKDPIDLTEYESYENFEELDFAAQNPKKYAFLKENGITVSQYNSFSAETKEAYSWAAQYPEKYEVAKVVSDSVTVYKRYTKALSALESDYDSGGKAISGSRKEKVVNYINGLALDYGEKIILFKAQYPSDDTYNYEIVDYLNSRRDLSYEQIVTILEELDFEVDSEGNVTW